MCAWGSDFKSCKSLLDRATRNDPTLTSMTILPMKTFTDADLIRLSEIIADGVNTHLNYFYSSGHNVSADAIEKFGEAIGVAAKNKNLVLTNVALGGRTMCDDGVAAFVRGLEKKCPVGGVNLLSLDLSAKNLTSRSLRLLSQSSSLCLLQRLNLSDNNFSKISQVLSGTQQSSWKSLESINFARCCVTPDDAQILFEVLSQSTNLAKVILSGNSDLTKGVQHLSSLPSNVSSISLDKCNLSDDDLALFCECGISTKLQRLDLSDNRLESMKVSDLINENGSVLLLEDLNLSNNKLSKSCLECLASKLLTRENKISSLDLAQTKVNTDCARKFISIPNLKYLRLFNNNLGDGDFFDSTTASLIASSDIKVLDLCGNNGTNLERFLGTLLGIYKNRSEQKYGKFSLETLELGANTISEEDENTIKELKVYGVDIARDKPKVASSK